MAVTIYVMKHQSKQRHLLAYGNTSKLKEIDTNNILQKMESNQKKLMITLHLLFFL